MFWQLLAVSCVFNSLTAMEQDDKEVQLQYELEEDTDINFSDDGDYERYEKFLKSMRKIRQEQESLASGVPQVAVGVVINNPPNIP
jgi:hypothetical protein